jgi:hypothetical protein
MVDKYSPAIEPNAKVFFDPQGVDTYGPRSSVPSFVASEGNLASALVNLNGFTILNTLLHEGNCGINAFHSGLNGPTTYTDQNEEGKREVTSPEFRNKAVEFAIDKRILMTEIFGQNSVEEFISKYNDPAQADWTSPLVWFCQASLDARSFRDKCVKYAEENKTELAQKYGDEEVAQFIKVYNSSNEEILPEEMWTPYLAWECAANIYGRQINLYSRSGVAAKAKHQTGPTFFELDENKKIKPIAVFTPEGKEPSGPPLNLFLFGPHYCTLIEKAPA